MENNIYHNLLKGKKGLVLGVANNLSLGWYIAEAASFAGAEIGFSYQGEILEKRIIPLAQSINSDFVEKCDVTDSESIKNLFERVKQKWGKLDFLVHAIGFSDKEELRGKYINTSLKNFLNTMHISCFSLTEICKHAVPLMEDGGSIITLTYMGSEKAMPNYNVMGVAKAALESSVRYLASDLGEMNIRVNAISAGPVKTLAASGIGDFREMLKLHENTAPLRRNTSKKDIAGAGVYLLSELSSGVTGEVHYVDCGYNTMGMGLQNSEVKSNEK